jgi:hypothetical protein
MNKNNLDENPQFSLIKLRITHPGGFLDLDNLNLNMIIKYKDEWYALNMKEKSMNDYFVIHREQLKTLDEHINDYYKFLAAIKDENYSGKNI